MMQLLKKDWRVNRTPIYGTIAVMASLTLMNLLNWLIVWHKNEPTMHQDLAWSLAQAFEGNAILYVYGAAWMAAIFGSMAFAHERGERSADFLAMLPLRKLTALISKIIVPAVCMGCAFGLILAFHIAAYVARLQSRNYYQMMTPGPPAMNAYGQIVALWLMLFGIAWLLSTFLKFPGLCACIAIATTVISLIILEDIFVPIERYSNDSGIIMPYFGIVGACSGLACFIVGSIYYLKRIEP
jgi:ABC-type transport system involved in multi-copper enzyme maturation permease subunit